MSFPVLDESMACAIFSDHTAQTVRTSLCSLCGACQQSHLCAPCISMGVCARACVGLQLVDTADKGWFWGLSLRAYSSSIGGWCVILNNWVTSVQTLSPSMSCLTSVLGALQVCGGTAWLGSALCDRLQWWKAVNISARTQSVRSSICDLTVLSQKHIHLNPYLRFIMAR